MLMKSSLVSKSFRSSRASRRALVLHVAPSGWHDASEGTFHWLLFFYSPQHDNPSMCELQLYLHLPCFSDHSEMINWMSHPPFPLDAVHLPSSWLDAMYLQCINASVSTGCGSVQHRAAQGPHCPPEKYALLLFWINGWSMPQQSNTRLGMPGVKKKIKQPGICQNIRSYI